MKELILVKMTQEDIANGCRYGMMGPCPIELALRRAVPWAQDISVGPEWVHIWWCDTPQQCLLGPDGKEFVKAFDSRAMNPSWVPPDPIDFWLAVEVPNE